MNPQTASLQDITPCTTYRVYGNLRTFPEILIQQVLDYRDDGVQKKPPDNRNPDNRGIYYIYDNLYCSKWSKISRYCEE